MILSVVILIAFGCQDLSPTAQDEQKDSSVDGFANLDVTTSPLEIKDQFMQQANRPFFHLAELVPGFGGVFLEEEATLLVIRVTDLDQIDREGIEIDVRNYLTEEAPIVGAAVEGGVQAIELRFREAAYEYTQLD